MSVLEAVAQLFLVTALLAAWRNQRNRFWLLLALGAAGSGIVALARFGLHVIVISGPVGAAGLFACVLLGLVLWGRVLGLPRPLALRIGLGLTSRPVRFHNRLVHARRRFDEATVLAQTDSDRRGEAIATVEAQMRRERGLRPPDAEWAALRDDLVMSDAAIVAIIRTGAQTEALVDHVADYMRLRHRWDEMRDRAAEDQRLLATPVLRRRGNAVEMGALGTSLLVMAVAQALALDMASVDLASVRLWLVAALFVGAALAFATSLADAVRRG